MRGRNITITKNVDYRGLLLFLLVTSFAFMFLNFKGTDDRKEWLRWASQTQESGLVTGYRRAFSDYPPLTFVILDTAVSVAHRLGLPDLTGIKLSLFLSLVATTAAFYAYTRNILFAVIFELALILNSVVLTYLDIYIAFFFILALWALQKGKLALFIALFVITFLIKWPPLTLAPFFALYILEIKRLKDVRTIAWKRILTQVIIPATLVIAVVLLIFGLPVLDSLLQALNDPFLSEQALNFNWILTYLLNVLDPSTYGHLANDVSPSYITYQDGLIPLLMRPLFWALFGVVLILWFRTAKTFENLMLYMLLGYLTYFTFGVGTHENHLYIAILLSAALAHVNRQYLPVFFTWALVANINMFVFYGVDGRSLPFSRVVWGFDTSIWLAAVNVMLFVAFFVGVVAPRR